MKQNRQKRGHVADYFFSHSTKIMLLKKIVFKVEGSFNVFQNIWGDTSAESDHFEFAAKNTFFSTFFHVMSQEGVVCEHLSHCYYYQIQLVAQKSLVSLSGISSQCFNFSGRGL